MGKLLLLGAKKNYNAEYFYFKAFNLLGYNTLQLNSYENVKHPLFSRLIHTRTSILNQDFLLDRFTINKNIFETIKTFDPDFILIFKGEFISNRTLKKLSESYKIYLFYPDTYRFKSLLKNRLYYYEAIFTAANKKEFYYKLGAKRVVTVPWACDPDFHKKTEAKKIYDVSFIGTAYDERKKIINKIKDVYVFGDFWDKKLYIFKDFKKNKKVFPPVFGEDYVSVINQSKINLNIHASSDVAADAPNMRTFEVSGCGAFQLVDYVQSLNEYFPFIPTYKNINELKELIDYYLNNETEREEIAIKSQERCYKFYKYVDAAKRIVSNL